MPSSKDDFYTNSSITLNKYCHGKESKIALISVSQIIRSTITAQISITDGSSAITLYELVSDATVLDDSKGGENNLLSINQAEMSRLLLGLIVGFGSDTETSTGGVLSLELLESLGASDLDTFLNSNTIVLVTDYILRHSTYHGLNLYDVYVAANGGDAPENTTLSAYILNNYVTYTVPVAKNYITAAGQKSMIEYASN